MPVTKIFGFPVKIFNQSNLMEEMLEAKDGTMFVLGQREIPQTEGRPIIEMTIARIQKVQSN